MAHGPLLVSLMRILPPIGASAPSLVGGSRWVPGHIIDGPVVTEVLADGLSTRLLELVAGGGILFTFLATVADLD